MTHRVAFAVALSVLTACTGSPLGEGPTVDTAAQAAPPIDPPRARSAELPRPRIADEPGAPVASPLTGEPIAPDDYGRRVIGVKIDNSPPARPQSGLGDAEAVVELVVGRGYTRFIAMFHASDSEYAGPIRSLRPADLEIATALGATMVVSGGQPWILALAADHGVALVDEQLGTFRIRTRYAPHNLYGSTPGLRETADGLGHPDDRPRRWLPFGAWEPSADAGTTLTIAWSAWERVQWRYDPEDEMYRRWTNGVPHDWVDAEGVRSQIQASVLVVLQAVEYVASPPPGTSGSSVPAVATTGTGDALIFSQGRVWLGTWERATATDPFLFFDGEGKPAPVPPGMLWLSLLPESRPLEFE